MMRYLKIVAIAAGAVIVFGVWSYFSEVMIWDGGFPAGEFRVNVRDPDGKPIKGASLRVYRGGTRNLAFNYPLDNHLDGQGLVSDENGRITAVRLEGGLQFGGKVRYLFGVIPIKEGEAPKYDCEITAEGFQPLKVRINELFKSPHTFDKDFSKTESDADGKRIELPVYEHTFTLNR